MSDTDKLLMNEDEPYFRTAASSPEEEAMDVDEEDQNRR